MKKILSILLSVSLLSFSTVVFAANTHKHTLTTQYTYLDNGKHSYQKQCSSCGKIISKSTQNHQPVNTNGTASSMNDKKHKMTYTCKYCGKQYTKELSHSFTTKVEKNGSDSTYHNVIKYCKQCGYNASTTKTKHTFNKGTCSKCGYQSTTQAYKAGGVCATYLGIGWNDNNIYKNCPKCGSYSAKVVKQQVIRKNQTVVGGKATIYHQHVQCDSCGKQYCNRCYAEKQ